MQPKAPPDFSALSQMVLRQDMACSSSPKLKHCLSLNGLRQRAGCAGGNRSALKAPALTSGLASFCLTLSLLASAPGLAAPARSDGKLSPGTELPPVSPLGSDMSLLPTRYPQGNWLKLQGPVRGGEPRVRIRIAGKEVNAVLDTGAMTSLMSRPMAKRLGLEERIRTSRAVTVMDSHGDTAKGYRVSIPHVAMRKHEWLDADFLVFGEQPDLLLIGADLLQDVDILLAAEEGWVGLFDAGQTPQLPNQVVIPVKRERRQLSVPAAATNTRQMLVPFSLIVDTGATHTSVPAWTGINKGLAADLAYAVQTLSVGGEQESRGRFVLDPLMLGKGHHEVGLVLALASTIQNGEGEALLGNDVLLRNYTLISFRSEEIRFSPAPKRPPHRTLGPGGVRCKSGALTRRACLQVRLDTRETMDAQPDGLSGICLAIDASPVYAGRTLELTITASDGDGRELFAGGVLRASITVGPDGLQKCFPLGAHLVHLGLTAKSHLSLRWVRAEDFRWPCDAEQTECLSFTGPMAALPASPAVRPGKTGVPQ